MDASLLKYKINDLILVVRPDVDLHCSDNELLEVSNTIFAKLPSNKSGDIILTINAPDKEGIYELEAAIVPYVHQKLDEDMMDFNVLAANKYTIEVG